MRGDWHHGKTKFLFNRRTFTRKNTHFVISHKRVPVAYSFDCSISLILRHNRLQRVDHSIRCLYVVTFDPGTVNADRAFFHMYM